MIGYVGVPGALVELPYRGGLSTSTDRPVKFTRTLGGKRKAQLGPAGRREWDVSFDLIGSRDALGLIHVAQFGGPVLWYPADAVAGNMLSPQASGFNVPPTNATDAGLVQLPDGTVARSVIHSGSGGVNIGGAPSGFEGVPVRAGVPVTVSAWGLGGLRLTGAWRSVTGANLGGFGQAAEAFTGWQFRSFTATPPAGAVAAQLILNAGTQYARPSISWGPSAVDRPGRGCAKAVVHGLSEALTVINADDAYGSIDVTITEVG